MHRQSCLLRLGVGKDGLDRLGQALDAIPAGDTVLERASPLFSVTPIISTLNITSKK